MRARLRALASRLRTAMRTDLQVLPQLRASKRNGIDGPAGELLDLGIVIREGFIATGAAAECLSMLQEFVSHHEAELAQAAERTNGSVEVETRQGTKIVLRRSHDGRESYDTGMLDIFHIDKELPVLEHIPTAPIEDMIRAVAGEEPRLKNANAYLNDGVEVTRGFHCDGVDSRQYKAFVYLTDVAEQDGPYAYIESSHRPSAIRYWNLVVNFVKGRPLTDMRHTGSGHLNRAVGAAGTLIVSNQRGFHRGMPQAPDRRRALIALNYELHSGA